MNLVCPEGLLGCPQVSRLSTYCLHPLDRQGGSLGSPHPQFRRLTSQAHIAGSKSCFSRRGGVKCWQPRMNSGRIQPLFEILGRGGEGDHCCKFPNSVCLRPGLFSAARDREYRRRTWWLWRGGSFLPYIAAAFGPFAQWEWEWQLGVWAE